jgi:hypothetical protein
MLGRPRLQPRIATRGQLALPWAADPLLIVAAISMHVRATLPDALLVPEFAILRGASRIDLALIGDVIDGWEVKGDLDDESRLPRQVLAYNRIFDRVTLVASPRSAARCERLVPTWWGLSIATHGDIDTVREPGQNQSCEPAEIADLLWRDELVAAHLAVTGRPGRGSRRAMAETLGAEIPKPALTALVAASIRARTGWRSAA